MKIVMFKDELEFYQGSPNQGGWSAAWLLLTLASQHLCEEGKCHSPFGRLETAIKATASGKQTELEIESGVLVCWFAHGFTFQTWERAR